VVKLYIAIVISPLFALMEDLVASYSAKGTKAAYTDYESDIVDMHRTRLFRLF
jgi:superfamily II DNA helicase RecQ